MILLDEVVQIFACPDFRLWVQQSALLQLRDSGVSSGVAIEGDPLGGAVLCDCTGKESFGRGNIAMFTEQEIDRESSPVDRTIEIGPSPRVSDELCKRSSIQRRHSAFKDDGEGLHRLTPMWDRHRPLFRDIAQG